MPDAPDTAEELLEAWLSLTSTLWNTRLVSSITFNEAHVLGILLRRSTPQNPLTATDLIKQTHLLKSQMNKILSTLEQKQYILRMRAEHDRRMAHIRLTDEGRRAYLAEHVGVQAILRELIGRIGDGRARALANELNDITAQMDDILSST